MDLELLVVRDVLGLDGLQCVVIGDDVWLRWAALSRFAFVVLDLIPAHDVLVCLYLLLEDLRILLLDVLRI